MIYDKTLLFSYLQAITATAASTFTVDLGEQGTPYGGNQLRGDLGKGCKIPLSVTVNTAFNNLTSLGVEVQFSDTDDFAEAKTVASIEYDLDELTAGSILPYPDDIPEGANRRYMRLRYVVNGTAPTTGSVTAGVVAARQSNLAEEYAG